MSLALIILRGLMIGIFVVAIAPKEVSRNPRKRVLADVLLVSMFTVTDIIATTR